MGHSRGLPHPFRPNHSVRGRPLDGSALSGFAAQPLSFQQVVKIICLHFPLEPALIKPTYDPPPVVTAAVIIRIPS